MRQGFNYQTSLGCTPINEVTIPAKTNSHMAAIQYIYITPKWNGRVAKHLSDKLLKASSKLVVIA